MAQAKVIVDAKTVVKWVGRIALLLVTLDTVLIYIDVLPQYDHYGLVWLLVLLGFGKTFSSDNE